MDLSLRDSLNRDLKDRFGGDTNDYDIVAVLALYWEDGDHPGFKQEAMDICECFRIVFNYRVEIPFAIPSEKSQLALEGAIISFIINHSKPHSLLIIHYGGHGDRDDDKTLGEDRRAVWAAQETGGPLLKWYEIQPKLLSCEGDVLLLLDCCYAAQASRARQYSNRIELVAAAHVGEVAAPPGPGSFTTKLIKEIRDQIRARGYVIVSHLYRQLMRSETKLIFQPVYIPLSPEPSRTSIRLERLACPSEEARAIKSAAFHLNIKVSMIEPLTRHMLPGIVDWLRTNAPAMVTSLEVQSIHDAKHLEDFILKSQASNQHSQESPLFNKLGLSGRNDISLSWEEVIKTLEIGRAEVGSQIAMQRDAQDTEDIKRKARIFLERLHTSTLAMRQAITRNVLALPEFENEKILEQAIFSETGESIGLSESLKMQLNILFSGSNMKSDLQIDPHNLKAVRSISKNEKISNMNLLGSGLVLVEYKYYDAVEEHVAIERVEALARLLNATKSLDFRTLRCLHWFNESSEQRSGFVLEIPDGYESPPVSLAEVIEKSKAKARPTLGERFAMALRIGQAVQHWHAMNWVHQSISSRDIVFFHRNGESRLDFLNPYLGGFEFSRPSQAPSTTRYTFQFETKIYRHPDRHPPCKSYHQKEHDLYSFGVVLLEIGLWKLMSPHFSEDEKRKISATDIQKSLFRNANERLSHFMGTSYKEAVCTCLNGAYGVSLDDKKQTQLSKAFQQRVMNKLASTYIL